ncbi:unnamed protein product [Triticum turgidum subsp. durum]|uniref:Protein kinase domain-containing protein n=1 Tax=Triticum turgidum subsp. durum TaxID=4567 RepID=A0A9R1B5J1_TRITD|nr:unnamed protein product [Triticum turgidum subsp. durum]
MKPPGALSPRHHLLPLLLLLLLLYHLASASGTDADALLALKSALDASNRLTWHASTATTLCTAWPGVRQCDPAGRVTKLVLENLNLTGPLTAALLSPLAELRVLSLKANALSGPVPDGLAAALPNLKLLYLASNALSGPLPASLGTPEEQAEEDAQQQHQQRSANAAALPPATNAAGGREFSWEREGIGKLVFCGGAAEAYSLEELLRASAETLGRGEAGSTYKAVMETGFIVTVKRMRCGDAGALEFGRRAEELGRVRHPNVVALRAYFQAKEERLLVYDYYPNGSLFSLVHGSRPSSKGKPLHWTSCMKIAEDIAAGLLHLHSSAIVHGNLKPSNVLLGPDFESCLTDYGLVPALHAAGADASSASLLYRAPETRSFSSFTAPSDVYSFGVLLLELLTGRAPFPDLLDQHGGADEVAAWVRAAREEEMSTESGGESAASGAAGPAEEKLGALVGVAAACVAADPGARPATAEALRMVREARAEAMSSSNSSDRSPARWSDAVIMGAPGPPTD